MDTGLAKFRRGLELIKICRGRLKQVENEFIEIKRSLVPRKTQLWKNKILRKFLWVSEPRETEVKDRRASEASTKTEGNLGESRS